MNNSKQIKLSNIFKWICYIGVIIFVVFIILSVITLQEFSNGNSFNEDLFGKYAIFSITIALLLFSFLMGTLLLVRRVTNVDIPYIFHTFKNMSNFNYDMDFVDNFNPYFIEENNIKTFIKKVYNEKVFLEEIKNLASNEYVLDDVLDKVFEKLNDSIRVDRIGVAFADYGREKIVAETAKINYGNVLLGPGFEVNMKNTSLTEILKTKKSKINNDLSQEIKGKKRANKSLDLIIGEGIQSNMIIPLILKDKVFGILFFSSFEKDSYDKKSLRIAENVAHSIASIIDQTYLTKKMLNNITLTFAELVEKKDSETGDHIGRMTKYSVAIAESMLNYHKINYRVTTSFVQNIELYAPLHDIGKVGIPDKILNKPAKLTSEEWVVMMEHTNIGANILTNLRDSLEIFGKQFYQMAIDVTRHHHEKWDGSGYPYGLKGEEIPLAARVVAIADVFDALVSRRPYKKSKPFDECVNIILEGSGSHFDPELVEIFTNNLRKIEKIYIEDMMKNNLAQIASL